jgi:hypothetical protein
MSLIYIYIYIYIDDTIINTERKKLILKHIFEDILKKVTLKN